MTVFVLKHKISGQCHCLNLTVSITILQVSHYLMQVTIEPFFKQHGRKCAQYLNLKHCVSSITFYQTTNFGLVQLL